MKKNQARVEAVSVHKSPLRWTDVTEQSSSVGWTNKVTWEVATSLEMSALAQDTALNEYCPGEQSAADVLALAFNEYPDQKLQHGTWSEVNWEEVAAHLNNHFEALEIARNALRRR